MSMLVNKVSDKVGMTEMLSHMNCFLNKCLMSPPLFYGAIFYFDTTLNFKLNCICIIFEGKLFLLSSNLK